jgi:hypothetical protein
MLVKQDGKRANTSGREGAGHHVRKAQQSSNSNVVGTNTSWNHEAGTVCGQRLDRPR